MFIFAILAGWKCDFCSFVNGSYYVNDIGYTLVGIRNICKDHLFLIVNSDIFVVYINRLKKSYDQTLWCFEKARPSRQKARQLDVEESLDENAEIQARPIATGYVRETQVIEKRASGEEEEQLDQEPQGLEHVETPGTDRNGRRQMPDSSVRDPDYEPPNSPRSRRELATTPIAPPVTRSRARLQLQENTLV